MAYTKRNGIWALGALLLVGWATEARAYYCYIFVHGRQDNTNTLTSYASASSYWKGQNTGWFNNDIGNYGDGIARITGNGVHKFYVIGYDGTKSYLSQSVPVAKEIVNAATAGSKDKGGFSCGTPTKYIVVAHSMGNAVMDFILGNARTTDANYGYGASGTLFAVAASKITNVQSLAGAHRGTKAADAACGSASALSNFLASWVSPCNDGATWLQTASNWQVSTYSNAPLKPIYLYGGYEGMADSAMLPGEDDGVVTHAGAFACSGDANASYSNGNVCSNSYHQEASGFYNRSAAHENHSDIRNGSDVDRRYSVASGGTCSTKTCFFLSELSYKPCSATVDEIACATK